MSNSLTLVNSRFAELTLLSIITFFRSLDHLFSAMPAPRSEERRVGKEC